MIPAGTWGVVSKLVLSALLNGRPERVESVNPRDIDSGPTRNLLEELQRRHAAGRPTTPAGLLAMSDEELAVFGWGRLALLEVLNDSVLAVDLDRYVVEARRLAVNDHVGRDLATGDLDATRLREYAMRLESGRSAPIGFVDAAAYLAEPDTEMDWVWRGYLAPGALTLLSAPPKRGKSTLMAGLVGALSGGATSFLGRAVTGGPVLWVSEESAKSLRPKLAGRRRHGLWVVDRRAAFPRRPWRDFAAGLAEEARQVGAVLVVIDTFPFWAGLGPDEENSAGATQAALEPLLELGAGGPSVLMSHHDRKGGGEDGEAVRGSTALAATVDCLIDMPRRPAAESPSSKRTLLAVSRWGDETPAALVFDRRADGTFAALAEGERDAVGRKALRARVEAAFGEEEVTVADIAEALGVSRQNVETEIKQLVDDGVVEVTQEHRGKQPRRLRLVATPAGCDNGSRAIGTGSRSPVNRDDKRGA